MPPRVVLHLAAGLAGAVTVAACETASAPEVATADLHAPSDPAACAAAAAASPLVLLSDPANCGACGHDCLGGACSSGVCQASVVGPSSDPGHAFYFEGALFFTGATGLFPGVGLYRYALEGGSTAKLAQLQFPDLEPNRSWQPSHFLEITGVDTRGVFVEGITQTTPTTERTEISFVPHAGGEARVLQAGSVTELIAAGATTYFRRFGPPAAGLRAEAVFAAPLAGGEATRIASLGSLSLGFEGYVSSGGRRALQVHDGSLYAITSSGPGLSTRDEISRVPTSGGAFAKLVGVTPDTIVDLLDVSGDVLVYAVRVAGPRVELRQTDVSTGQTDVLVDHFPAPQRGRVVIEPANVWFLDDHDGVSRLARDDGRVTPLAQFPTLTLGGLFADDRALYWTVYGDHGAVRLMRLAK